MIPKEVLGDFAEKFIKAHKLIKEDSIFDPDTEPFFSKYAARQILLNLITQISDVITKEERPSNDNKDYIKLIGLKGATLVVLAIVAFDTEEFSIGENHLKECEEIITPHRMTIECASVAFVMYNELGVYYHRLESEKGLEYLETAEFFYNDCKGNKIELFSLHELFLEESSTQKKSDIESSFTLTLFFLAQGYSKSNPLKSAIYCHRTVKRQLELKEDSSFDFIDWALNTATLSQYFASQNAFKQARHHLSASSYILELYKGILDSLSDNNEENNAKKEEYAHRLADVARCWSKYCYCLLIASKERLMSDNNVSVSCTDISLMNLHDKNDSIKSDDLNNLFFDEISCNIKLEKYNSLVTDKYVSVYEDAKPVFLLALKFLSTAQEYYTLENMASDFIEIVQEQSKLYSLTLTFFDENSDNCAKLYKRAIDLLENVLKEINHKYYLKYCHEIWHRLGQLYSNILDIKMEKFKSSNERPSADTLSKINMLIDKSNQNYTLYINSTNSNNKVIPELEYETYLLAHFSIAALSRKYITFDKVSKLRNAKNSLKHFQFVIDFCKENENAVNDISDYVPIAKELVTLIPIEINKLAGEVGPLVENLNQLNVQ